MDQRTQLIVGLVAALLVGAGLAWYYLAFSPEAELNPTLTEQNEAAQTENQTETADPSQTAQSAQVEYTSSGFKPKKVTVPVGTTVTFANNSERQLWVASNPHPAHSQHPSFDANRGFSPEEDFSYTFENSSTYQYHNHLAPNHTGTVVVE